VLGDPGHHRRPADTAPVLGYAVATAPENQAASGSFA
jgi:hypothetical protein